VSFTDLATGKSFTNVLNIVNKDLKVTDNGDGTLTIVAMTTGSIKNYGPDGNLLFNDPGQIRIEIDPGRADHFVVARGRWRRG
jgi:hypothetical protein